jgi:uncharacterized protein
MTDVLLLLTGVIVGAMNAIAGGGMLIGFPVLMATGMPALVANATSSIVVLPGLLSAAFGYRKYIKKIPRRYLLLAIPCVLGAALGTVFLRRISMEDFQEIIPGLILFALVLFIFQPFLHNHTHRHIHGPKRHRDKWAPLVLLGLAFFPLAIYGGFFGTGFGFIMLAFLGFTKLHEIHRMNALKSLLASVITCTTLLSLGSTGLIDWRHGLVMGFGNLVGGYAGAHSAQKVSSHAIRIVVIAVGVCSAAYLLFHNY